MGSTKRRSKSWKLHKKRWIKRAREKKINWYTTYGEILIFERVLLESGKTIRPFSNEVKVKNRGYSCPLERRITDFGADDSFKKAIKKLKEHYGIKVPVSSTRAITEKHAKLIKKEEVIFRKFHDGEGVDCIIAGMDGTMIPIVETEERELDGRPIDKRKTRKVRWKEGRLTLAHEKGSLEPIFGATTGKPEVAGDYLANCAIRTGIGVNTHVHCVGDGAPWINDQCERVFGDQAEFLIDFFHLCEYLAAASKKCNPENPVKWLDKQKKRMKSNLVEEVLQELEPYLESTSLPDKDAPVRCCNRYLKNRPGQFNYKDALENDLAIGSGEVESAHRYVIQDRLKISGAWWSENNAKDMLALRVLRENGDWDTYWEKKYQHAA